MNKSKKLSFNKILCLILAVIMIFSIFAMTSCAKKENAPSQENKKDAADAADVNADTTDEAEAENVRLPFEPTIIDLEGRDFTIADCGWGTEITSEQRDVYAEKDTGETINDAVYKRNIAIEEMFKCTIKEQKYYAPGDLGRRLKRT